MNWQFLAERILAGEAIRREEALTVLSPADDELLAILSAAFVIRRKYFGWGVALHVIRNAKSGLCEEDCAYCSQSKRSQSAVEKYPLQSEHEILQGAREAHALKALRYCIVSSGRGPRASELSRICRAVRRIKAEVPIQICTSLGLLTDCQARQLKEAGVDRFNHNLETSERYYPEICRTHTYAERLATARAVKTAGLELCSGGLIGMGESLADRVDLAFALRATRADSIPVNFLDPRPGTPLERNVRSSPADCLRTLAMFRFVNPDREIRVAGGREACLGSLQVLALYPANSIFTNGYLTTPGQGHQADLKMIAEAGFEVVNVTQA